MKLTKEDIPGASLEGRLPSQKIEERNSGLISWRLLQRTQNKEEYVTEKLIWNLRRPRC